MRRQAQELMNSTPGIHTTKTVNNCFNYENGIQSGKDL